MECREISAKLMWIQATLGGEGCVFVNASFPGSGKSKEETEGF